MLQKSAKINRTAFIALKNNKSTSTVYNPLGTLYFLKNDKKIEFSVVISGKAVPHAVDRNRIRRRLYSLVQKQKNPYFSGILFTAKNIQTFSYEETTIHFQNLMDKMQKNTK